jgi:hypothetical protein
MTLLAHLKRHRVTVAVASVIVIGAATLVVVAASSDGYRVEQTDLADGGVWVTNDHDGLFGRVNKPAAALDAALAPPGGAKSSFQLDIVQDASAVVAIDRVAGKLLPVDVSMAVTKQDQGVPIDSATRVGLAGGTLAVLNTETGQLRAERVDRGRGVTGLTELASTSPPLAEVGPKAAMAVALDGTVFAVSRSGKVAALRPNETNFNPVEYREIGAMSSDPRVTAVGAELVVQDGGSVVLPSGRKATLDSADAVAQQPGPASSSVVFATTKNLLSVDLDTATTTTLYNAASGAPAAPVRVGGCVHAAWASTPNGYVRSCREEPARPGNLGDVKALERPEFRVNRGSVVLNDLATGAVWDLTNQQRVDNWSAVKPPPKENPSEDVKNKKSAEANKDKPPKAVDDTAGARPGRSAVLYVLDNDSDPTGDVLSISGVTAPDVQGVTVAIAPDGQTIRITLPDKARETHFKYTVDNGSGFSATAAVTVQVRSSEQNDEPALRNGRVARQWPVTAGGTVSGSALSDWRDFDGDPVALVDTEVKAGSAVTTPTGLIEYAAPLNPGPQPVNYRVTDGFRRPGAEPKMVPGTETVMVQDVAGKQVAPTALPDAVRGQAGQPITVRPLDNDLVGADPTDPAAALRLAGEVASPADVTVGTDVGTGVLVVTASKPGTWKLDYRAAFGNAPLSTGVIRVDVTALPPTPEPPLAMPDAAVVRGQQPAVVDVLANDKAPSGAVLAVRSATPVGDDPQVQVAVLRGRWLRINALSPAVSRPQLVRYTVTDGVSAPVTGEVSITQLGPAPADTPVPVDDRAVVRAGDSAVIPVLDNDISPSGAQLILQENVSGAPERGRLTVSRTDGNGDQGAAYVTGSVVRFQAPEKVDAPTILQIDYVAMNPAGDQATGHVQVTVMPTPTPQHPNRTPAPRNIEARVVAGDTVVMRVPTTGVDPDGDTVSVVGIASAASIGRVTAIGATSITYEAYPTSGGTDSFQYVVTDPYGGKASASVRVAVVGPGDPQPPVAVDDVTVAAPGARLAVDVLANDLYGDDDKITIEPLDHRNRSLPGGISLDPRSNTVDAVAPDATGKPTVVVYAVTNGIGEPSVATLTIRSQEGHNTPPVPAELDANPRPGDATTTVTVLDGCSDPDGSHADLRITKVFDPRAVVDDGKISLPVGDHARTVAYEIADGGGATALGLLHVRPLGAGGPYAVPDKTITVDRDGEKAVDLADYVTDPSGKQVRLTTTDLISASPTAGLKVRNDGDRRLVLNGQAGYAGPAAITFEVTNGASITEGVKAMITVPVQVGPPTPVLRCPTTPLTLVAGGPTSEIDVAAVCHVWLADPATRGSLSFAAKWAQQPQGVDVRAGAKLALTASGSAPPGAEGTLSITVEGTEATPATLAVRVIAAPAPSVSPVTVDGVKAGETATVDLASYVRSRLRDPAISVVSIRQTGGMPASTDTGGSTVRLTPGTDSHGRMTFAVVVSDVADRGRTDRQVTGQITLNVLGVPDAPGTPAPGRTVLSRVVELTWSSPANNGAPIETFEVDYGRGTQTCAASPCTITGLENGTSFTFTVRARNVVGWSKPSGSSAPAQPNTVPDAVTALRTSAPRDGSLRLDWNAPNNDGTPVQRYEVSWTGGGSRTAGAGATTITATGLNNNTQYSFTVVAVNAQGPGPSATVDGQSAGAPATPAQPSFTAADSADASSRAVRISWQPVGPNGPGPTTYTLSRSGGSGGTKTVCSNVTATTCADDGLANDGTIYAYSVVAANSAAQAEPNGHVSAPSPAARMEATATPDPITGVSATPTGNDGQATLRFNAPASHGATNTVTCRWSGGSCGTWTYSPNGQPGVSQTVSGLPNGQQVSLTLQSCNGSGGGSYAGNPCDSPVSTPVTTFGPLRNLVVNASANGSAVDFSISVNPNGKPATVHVQTSRQNQTFTTGPGQWSWSGRDDVGYSSSDTVSVTVSDAGRQSLSDSRTVNTPPPPAPPASVTVSKGGPCGGGGGAPCGGGSCTHSSCAYITVQTANFGGRVTCTFNSDHGPGGFVTESFGPNERRQTRNWYGYPGESVYVTCGGVQGSYRWQ